MTILNPNIDPATFVQKAIDLNKGLNDKVLTQKIQDLGSDFQAIAIAEENWNQAMPFQLQIVDSTNGYAVLDGLVFTLPIPPKEMSVQTHFASNVVATLAGIAEENSGAPFRVISFQSTMGIAPLRPSSKGPASNGVMNSIFAGTITGGTNAVATFNRLFNQSVTPNNVIKTMGPFDGGTDNLPETSTGFYQFQLLNKFLEYYAALRQTSKGINYRLALAIYKENCKYIVTPMTLEQQRNVSSPMEYIYRLQLKAWKRVPLNSTIKFTPSNSSNRSPGAIAVSLMKIQEARSAVQSLSGLLNGIRSDVNTVLFEPLRETALFLQDAIGVQSTYNEMPATLQQDFKLSVASAWSSLGINLTSTDSGSSSDLINNSFSQLAITQSTGNYSSSTGAPTTSGNNIVKKNTKAQQQASPIEKILDNPNKYHDIFSQINVSDLSLSVKQQQAISDEITRVKQKIDRNYFEQKRIDIQALADDLADSLGLGDSLYNSIYDRPTVVASKTPTDDDYTILFNLNKLAMEYDTLAINAVVSPPSTPKSLDYIAGLAQGSGIAFTIPTSKFAVPFPYGSTLEMLASQYLKDPNRWLEIAALNGLRSPYVDETGFDLTLLNNGNQNQIFVSDVSNLYVNQPVFISSQTVIPEKRHILQIQKITSSNYLLTLDGNSDLNKLTTVSQAKLHAYLPGTVNSQMSIYIPSDLPADEDPKLKAIPGVNDYDGLLYVSGIDLLLDVNNDIILTPEGDSKLAFGLSNLIQSARIALSTPKGVLLQHPDYGIGVKVGDSQAEVSAKDILNNIVAVFQNDSRFSNVSNVNVSKQGGTIYISVSLQVAGTNHILPLTATVQT